jgi:cytochrome c peroxidase
MADFLRFVGSKMDADSGFNAGPFELAYGLRGDSSIDEADRQLLNDAIAWFEKFLPTPDRFNRSRSKGYYRRPTRGIAWFRHSATECIARMHVVRNVLEAYGYPVAIIRESRIGYIVYEDAFQVIAEPFAETNTGP